MERAVKRRQFIAAEARNKCAQPQFEQIADEGPRHLGDAAHVTRSLH